MKKISFLHLGLLIISVFFTSCADSQNNYNPSPSSADPVISPTHPRETLSHAGLPGNLAYISNRDNTSEIFMMDTLATESQLTYNMRVDSCFSWAPDGSNIAYSSSADGNIYTVDTFFPYATTKLTSDTRSDHCPSYSPSGSKIAFARDYEAGPDFWSPHNKYILTTNPPCSVQPCGLTFPHTTPIVVIEDFNSDGIFDSAEIHETTTDGYAMLTVMAGTGPAAFDSLYKLAEILVSTTHKAIYLKAAGLNTSQDSHMDLLVLSVASDLNSGIISVYMGNGDGTFSKIPADIPVGKVAVSGMMLDQYAVKYRKYLDIGDANNDNISDLFLLVERENKVQIFMGNGDGTFNTAAPSEIFSPDVCNIYANHGDVGEMLVGNFNADANIDIALFYCYIGGNSDYQSDGFSKVGIFTGDGTGSFQSVPSLTADISAGAFAPVNSANKLTSGAAGDLDGDSLDEIVLFSIQDTFYNRAVISLDLFENPPGVLNYTHNVAYSAGHRFFTTVHLADENSDNILDIFLLGRQISEGWSQIIFMNGNGDNTFKPYTKLNFYVGKTNYTSVVTADLENDGINEIIVAQKEIPSLRGNYGYTHINLDVIKKLPPLKKTQIFTMNPDGSGEADLTSADSRLKNDFKWDISWTDDSLRLLFSGSNPNMRGFGYPASLVLSYSGLINSSDGSGYMRIVPHGSPDITDGINSALPVFSSDNRYISYIDSAGTIFPFGWQVKVKTPPISVFTGFGTSFSTPVEKPFFYEHLLYAIASGDFNNDGFADIAAGYNGTDPLQQTPINSVKLFLSDGAGGYNPPLTVFQIVYDPDCCAAYPILDIIAGDFGSSAVNTPPDGNIDILVHIDCLYASCSQSNYKFIYGNGDGTFSAPSSYTFSTSRKARQSYPELNKFGAVGDLDKDGDLDVVTGNTYFYGLNVALNNAPWTFSKIDSNLPHSLIVADFNGDTYPDVAGAKYLFPGSSPGYANQIIFYYNQGVISPGTLTYSAADIITVTGDIFDIASGDFDKDGNTDIACANDQGTLYIFFGKGTGTGPTSFTQQTIPLSYTPTTRPRVSSGDFNGDTYDDIAVLGKNGDVLIYSGSAARTFIQSTGPRAVSAGQNMIAGNLSGSASSPDDIIVYGKVNAFFVNNTVDPLCDYSFTITNPKCSYVPFRNPSDYPSWSPDNLTLAFSSFNAQGHEDIFTTGIYQDSQKITVNSPNANDFEPSWSPDGSKIAFVSDRDNIFEIYLIDNTTGFEENMSLDTTAAEWYPVWSPVFP